VEFALCFVSVGRDFVKYVKQIWKDFFFYIMGESFCGVFNGMKRNGC
jgi:hypothetical protein